MKKIQYYGCWLALLLLAACNENDGRLPENAQYTINGTISFPSDNTLYLQEIVGESVKVVDSVSLKGKTTFQLKGKLKEPNFYRVALSPNSTYFFPLDTATATLSISGTPDMVVFKMSGTKLVNDFNKIAGTQQKFKSAYDSLNRTYILAENMGKTAELEQLDKDFANFSRQFKGEVKNMALSMDKSIVTLYAASFFDPKEDFTFLDTLAVALEPISNTSDRIKSFVEGIGKMKALAPGGIAPNFTGNTPDGRKVSLADYKGKVVMIDFWASWCGPCRKENPNVVKIYNKFKDKGFEILGVSLDESATKWKQAIASDGLLWEQVSDLNGWDSEFAKLYEVEAIPQTFLIGKDGKIVGRNLFGPELEKKLEEIL